ncbi:hypothetical protein DOTSEDRAFT_77901 [Dothistroma septosporum NZE10]|uniref:Uncharacterized protein n=1 Tax=Dothistroma septosporum (strain NZE10 / CBS 128990) TaxID=675120 RepID=N1PVZ8_DOTSN|nr:hypothetical protein DOTSEDRAFT_77901 [Dothistroma septosporum NZE10]
MTSTAAFVREDFSNRASRIPSKRPSAQPKYTIPRPPPSLCTATTTKPPPRKPASPLRRIRLATNPPDLPSPRQPPALVNKIREPRVATTRQLPNRLANGLLTSGSVGSRASSTSQDTPTSSMATPPAPKKRQPKADGGKDGDKAAVDSESLFMQGHIGEHCIKGALVHQLACSHKVMTVKVETCASNCVRPLAKHLEEHANRATEEAFICSACVEQHVLSHREAKRALFEQTYKFTEQKMIALPHGWLDKQRLYWEKVWENDIVMERNAFALFGRKCAHFGEHVIVTHGKKGNVASMAVPFPPKRRPKRSRAPDGRMPGPVPGCMEVSNTKFEENNDSNSDSISEWSMNIVTAGLS